MTRAGDRAVGYFYAWLFARHPELRSLFPTAMDKQRDRLFQALVRVVGSLSAPGDLAAYLGQLGRDHRKFSVQPGMYQAFGEALLTTVRAYSGPAFTPAAEAAWARAYSATADLMIRAAQEVQGPSQWSAEVVGCDYRGHGIAIITVAPDPFLPYTAGQHVTVQTPRWPRVWRPFSVSCAPRDDGLVSFHIRAIPGGWVSTELVRNTRPGDRLILGPAMGTMTLPADSDADLLCVAGGTGLAPLKAIAEQVIASSSAARRRQVFLFCGARTGDELYDLPDLWRLCDTYPWLQVFPVTSDDRAFPGLRGTVGQVAAQHVPHADCEAYVAGPPGMVRETIRALASAGLPGGHVHYDTALLAGR